MADDTVKSGTEHQDKRVNMEDRLERMEGKIGQLMASVEKLTRVIGGDLDGNTGMMVRQRDADRELVYLRKSLDTVKQELKGVQAERAYQNGIIATIAALGGWVITVVWKKLFGGP